MKVKDIVSIIETFAPLGLQEDFDNSGLAVGNPDTEITAILCTLDVTNDVIEEAIAKKVNMIISHHPVIFKSLKSLTGKNATENLILKAVKNDIVLYSVHTNVDNIAKGVNHKICELIGLSNCEILAPLQNKLLKLVTFVPDSHAEKVRNAMFEAGAGHIGNYDSCSFSTKGTGTFQAGENTKPYVGQKGNLHSEHELRIETVVPLIYKNEVIHALLNAHPYEEVAYDIIPLMNEWTQNGAGMIGEFSIAMNLNDLLAQLSKIFDAKGIRFAGNESKPIKRVAVCGGSGSTYINEAKKKKADVYITGDIKYHQFFEADNNLIIIDIGHYESEQYTKDIFYELLKKKISNFAVHLSEVKTNPIKYY